MMTETLDAVLFTILLIAIFSAVMWGCMLLSMLLFKNAVYSVLEMFWEANAVDEKNARTPAELGFRQSLAEQLLTTGIRDYKPQALQLLIAYNIVLVTEDEKLYLCEENLASKIPLLQVG